MWTHLSKRKEAVAFSRECLSVASKVEKREEAWRGKGFMSGLCSKKKGEEKDDGVYGSSSRQKTTQDGGNVQRVPKSYTQHD